MTVLAFLSAFRATEHLNTVQEGPQPTWPAQLEKAVTVFVQELVNQGGHDLDVIFCATWVILKTLKYLSCPGRIPYRVICGYFG